MELKVWVEGIQRIVCGVTESTTCQDVVYALAHATAQTGRFTLIERWRSNERLLAPHEQPLKILLKWGEYSNEVHLILRRSPPTRSSQDESKNSDFDDASSGLDRNRDSRRSSTFSPSSIDGVSDIQMENVAIVQPTQHLKSKESNVRKYSQKSTHSVGSEGGTQKKGRDVPPYREPPGAVSIQQTRTLPPYREPPPPNLHSPSRAQFFSNTEFQEGKVSNPSPNMVSVAYTQRYVELIRLVNKQRDTINNQQADLTKFDAEIMYWETKSREQIHQMDYMVQEVNRIESAGRMIEEQLKELAHVEEESEIVRQQEKTLKSEITLLRSKLANCETELLQCKNKIRLVMEELAMEQHNANRETNERQSMERKMISEVEHLQNEVEQAKRTADLSSQCAESLKHEVANLETAIVEKKLQVERLVADMKEANLQSLATACQDEQVKSLLEGAQKPGSTRKMIGSPRQLETAVPTSKNPHGVWV